MDEDQAPCCQSNLAGVSDTVQMVFVKVRLAAHPTKVQKETRGTQNLAKNIRLAEGTVPSDRY